MLLVCARRDSVRARSVRGIARSLEIVIVCAHASAREPALFKSSPVMIPSAPVMIPQTPLFFPARARVYSVRARLYNA
jgi:hypothetical protein